MYLWSSLGSRRRWTTGTSKYIVKQIRIIAMQMLHFYKWCKHKSLPTSWADAVVHLRKLKRSLAHLPDILKCVVNTKAFLLGRYRCSSPSTKEVPSAPTSWAVTIAHLHQLKRSLANLPDILKCVVITKAFLLGRYHCSSPSTKEVPSVPTWPVHRHTNRAAKGPCSS